MKKTPWFPERQSPVRPGLYEVRGSYAKGRWSVFDGTLFNGVWTDKETAIEQAGWGVGASFTHWRGISKEGITRA